MDIFKSLLEKVDCGRKCVLATVVEKTGDGPVVVGGRLLMDSDGGRLGSIGGGAIEQLIINTCDELIATGKSEMIGYDLTGEEGLPGMVPVPMICGGTVKIFYEYFEPKPIAFIFGSGNVGREIVNKLEGIGFKRIVVDPVRPNDLAFEAHFEDYQQVVSTMVDKESYVVISTGSHEVDYDILKAIVAASVTPKYLGMLASKKKSKELLNRLEKEIDALPKSLYSPIGLGIGGGKPAEIGISIVAQLQAKRYAVEKVEDMSTNDLHRHG